MRPTYISFYKKSATCVTNMANSAPPGTSPNGKDKTTDEAADQLRAMRATMFFSKRLAPRRNNSKQMPTFLLIGHRISTYIPFSDSKSVGVFHIEQCVFVTTDGSAMLTKISRYFSWGRIANVAWGVNNMHIYCFAPIWSLFLNPELFRISLKSNNAKYNRAEIRRRRVSRAQTRRR